MESNYPDTMIRAKGYIRFSGTIKYVANKVEKAVFQLSRDIGNSKEPSAIVQNINSLPGVALSLRFGKALLKRPS